MIRLSASPRDSTSPSPASGRASGCTISVRARGADRAVASKAIVAAKPISPSLESMRGARSARVRSGARGPLGDFRRAARPRCRISAAKQLDGFVAMGRAVPRTLRGTRYGGARLTRHSRSGNPDMNPIRKMALCCTVEERSPWRGGAVARSNRRGRSVLRRPVQLWRSIPLCFAVRRLCYVPGYRGRAWDYPIGEDNNGRPFSATSSAGARTCRSAPPSVLRGQRQKKPVLALARLALPSA